MSQRIYRTALGKQVDMGALLLRNENVRAVGNMGVNAKGDKLNDANKVVSPRNEQVNKGYRKQIRNQIVDVPVQTQTPVPKKEQEVIEGLDNEITTKQVADEPIVAKKNTTEKAHTKKKASGLASAIAKAREVEQKKLKTPREESRSKKGVKKI